MNDVAKLDRRPLFDGVTLVTIDRIAFDYPADADDPLKRRTRRAARLPRGLKKSSAINVFQRVTTQKRFDNLLHGGTVAGSRNIDVSTYIQTERKYLGWADPGNVLATTPYHSYVGYSFAVRRRILREFGMAEHPQPGIWAYAGQHSIGGFWFLENNESGFELRRWAGQWGTQKFAGAASGPAISGTYEDAGMPPPGNCTRAGGTTGTFSGTISAGGVLNLTMTGWSTGYWTEAATGECRGSFPHPLSFSLNLSLVVEIP